MSNDLLQQLRTRIIFEYNVLLTLQDPQTGLKLGPIFANIPSSKEVPGYYDVIKYPMTFSILKEKLLNYVNIIQWIVDIAFLPWNAKKYYGPQSEYFRFADIIETHLRNVMIPRLQTYYPNIIYPDLDTLIRQQQQKLQQQQQQQLEQQSPLNQPLQSVPPPPIQSVSASTVQGTTKRLPTLQQTNASFTSQDHNVQMNAGVPMMNINRNIANDNIALVNGLKYNRAMLSNRQNTDMVSPQQLINNNNITQQSGFVNPDNDFTAMPNDSMVSSPMLSSPSPNTSSFNVSRASLGPSEISQNSNSFQPTSNDPLIAQNKFVIPTTALNPSTYLPQVPTREAANSKAAKVKKKVVKRGRPPAIDFPYVQRMRNIVKNVRRTRLPGVKESVTSVFEKLPNKTENPNYYKLISNPISFEEILKKVKGRKYKDFGSFHDDIVLMVSNFRRYHVNDTVALGKLAHFEKEYKGASQYELARPDKDFIPEGEFRYPLEDAFFQNVKYKIGDWVLIANPNDSTKPIVGQIFKIWKTRGGEIWFNACWYFRPEQTVHRVDRLFYKNEVVKSGHYRDHQLEELVGHCYVIHFTRYQRGDPIFEEGIDSGPLFVCEFRYNENDKIFNKIRTWRACLPEEVRDLEEKNKPVMGRRFFKFESPLKNLLPGNATPNDPIPEAQMGNPNGPPLVGAVYMGPVYTKDDLGEFSTSLDCPRYIIRPGEPYEEGIVDEEHGLLAVDLSKVGNINYNAPRPSHHHHSVSGVELSTHNSRHSTPKNAGTTSSLKSLKKDHKIRKSSVQLAASVQALTQMVSQYNSSPTNKKLSAKNITLTKSAILKNVANKASLQDINNTTTMAINNTTFPTTLANNRNQSSGNFSIQSNASHTSGNITNNDTLALPIKRGRVVVDAPNAYLFPLGSKQDGAAQIRTDDLNCINSDVDRCVQRADKGSQYRRLSKEEFRHRKSNRYGEVLWFKGSSLNIAERMINLGDSNFTGSPLDVCEYITGTIERIDGLKDMDYEEIVTEADTEDMKESTITEARRDASFDLKYIPSPIKMDPVSDGRDKSKTLRFKPTSMGLKPSSSYIAYKLNK